MITPQTNTTLAEIAQRFLQLDDFVICGHVSPDGDCLSSQLTLLHALRSLGKKAACLLCEDEPVDASLHFLPGIEEVLPVAKFSGTPRVFVACDVPIPERIEETAAALQAGAEVTFTLDHHAVDRVMSDYTYVDPDAASTTMLIWELIKEMGIEPTREMALCAYTGLVTDTGNFQYQNTDSRAFSSASEMVALGIEPAAVATEIFQNRSLASLLLEKILLSRLIVDDEKRYVLSYLSLEDFSLCGAQKADAEPLINILRSLEGVRVACVLRETQEGIRGSIRAKDETDVAQIARVLGGGGHKAAAGFTMSDSLEVAREKVRVALNTMM
ncbi:MAG: DHH family phosphoesterase [Eggerthellaceae bacterium]|jgi:phosphoesterase RecJ-like protein|nr:DHH family phosphoesterase [Eggerthellaceae bacterium]